MIQELRAGPDAVPYVPPRYYRRHRVVCVDDEPGVLAALRRIFRHEPVELLATSSPEQARQWVAAQRVSVLITDQRMPGMTGTELLRDVAERSPQTRLVVLTAYPDRELFDECLRRGARELVTKPWNDDSLRWLVAGLLREIEENEAP